MSRTALLASVNLAALPVVRLSTLSLSLASGRSLMICPIGSIAAGREIIAPQHVDQFRARLERHRLLVVLVELEATLILSNMPGFAV